MPLEVIDLDLELPQDGLDHVAVGQRQQQVFGIDFGPADANQETIKAAFKNGVLTITMDKREASAPRQGRSIPING
ncbi:Hsp20 family protein [Stenotrophomonas maltophilia]|uniref:Hsp20 family protein n=1 Tax=Stenotrophomonas maltophilia TaxID=40324 RepID=UPI003D015FC1